MEEKLIKKFFPQRTKTARIRAIQQFGLPTLIVINRLLEPIEWKYKSLFKTAQRQLLKENSLPGVTAHALFKKLPEREPAPSLFKQKDQPEKLGIARILEVFQKNGAISSQLNGYEYRPQQIEMARVVGESLNRDLYIIVEAGTGIGKSWAYLVPSVHWAVKNTQYIVVSTNTKNLQEQLFSKDIPFLRKSNFPEFKYAILKGRPNYLCLERFSAFLEEEKDFTRKERLFLVSVLIWLTRTKTGDIAENPVFSGTEVFKIWEEICCEVQSCLGKQCPLLKKCFLYKARDACRGAHLILVNHSLLFSDLTAEREILPSYQHLIFDEAQNLEKVATEYLGVEANFWMMLRILNRTYQRQRGGRERGVLVRIRYKLKNLLTEISPLVEEVQVARAFGERFFDKLATSPIFKFDEATNKLRLYPHSEQSRWLTREIKEFLLPWNGLFAKLLRFLKKIDREKYPALTKELEARIVEGDQFGQSLNFIAELKQSDFVYWIEKQGRFVSLLAAPLEVGERLKNLLYAQIPQITFSSATLTVDKKFDFFKSRLGLDLLPAQKVDSLFLGSPFDYKKNVKLFIPTFLKSPKDEDFTRQVCQLLGNILQITRGNTMILFTSYKMLNKVYAEIKIRVGNQLNILGQGIDGPRSLITEQFKANAKSVLFGTQSFWEGVDFPGKILQWLVLVRLPFSVPSEPIVEARVELLRKKGKDPFEEYYLPEAIIRFRQGFGRLIRSKTDRGGIIILDKRILTAAYGKKFLQSVPECDSKYYYHQPDFLKDLQEYKQLLG